MTGLAFTTSGDNGSLALIKKNKIHVVRSWKRTKQHSEVLILSIEKILKNNNILPAELEFIAVDKGPGSFTGCRMAVNVAKTFGYTLSIPIYAVSSLDIIAASVKNRFSGEFFCIADAHKSLLYGRQYTSNSGELKAVSSVRTWEVPELCSLLNSKKGIFGLIPPAANEEFKKTQPCYLRGVKFNVPQADVLGMMCIESFKASQNTDFVSWSEVEPSYIRAPEAYEKFFSSRTKV